MLCSHGGQKREEQEKPDLQPQPDPDSFSFQEEDFETIPWSVNYVLVCILLPALCGGLSSFAWAGQAVASRGEREWQTANVGEGMKEKWLVHKQ